MAIEGKAMMTVSEAAKALGLGYSTVRKILAAGRIQSVKFGTRRLVMVDSLNQFVSHAAESGQIAGVEGAR